MANLQIPVDQAILPEWLPSGLPAESKVTPESFSCAEPSHLLSSSQSWQGPSGRRDGYEDITQHRGDTYTGPSDTYMSLDSHTQGL